jgi:8-oxo-dGTP diphosphatase
VIATNHPSHISAVVGCVRDDRGRVLLVRVAARGWEMPGGQVEEGEDLVTALQREIEEESSCRVSVGNLVGVYSKVSPPTMVLHLFACSHVGGSAAPREAEVPEVGWFEPDEARRLVSHPPGARRLADALAPDRLVYRAYRLDPYEELVERPM